MTSFNTRGNGYLIPKRVMLALKVIAAISKKETSTVDFVVKETKFSRAYVLACCLVLKKHGIVTSTRGIAGGYSLVKGLDETTVSSVLLATSKAEDRGGLTSTLHKHLIRKTKNLTVSDLLGGSDVLPENG